MIFAGGSSFATDFQQVIDRAVAIAALPLVQLENQRANLALQSTALKGLEEQFNNLQGAIAAMDSAISTELHTATVSDETIAQVNLSGNVFAGDYSLNVTSLGARSLTLSLDSLPSVADPFTESVSASANFTLTVDGADHAITPVGGSLFDLASAINAAGAGLQATVVNIGGSASPDYRLSIQSEKYAPVAIQLNDGSQDLLQTLTTGSSVVYSVNGVPAGGISSDTRTVTVSPGVSVNLLKTGSTEFSIAKTTASLGDALANFVTAYNSTTKKLDLHRGTTEGALSGQAVVFSLARAVGGFAGYTAADGNLRSLADIGLEIDQQGVLSFNEDTFQSKPIDDVLAFLGTSTTGGFLKTVTDVMNAVQDSTDGMIALEKASIEQQIARQDKLIASNDARIETLRENLLARMAAADSVIAVLEQQALGIKTLFEAMASSREALK